MTTQDKNYNRSPVHSNRSMSAITPSNPDVGNGKDNNNTIVDIGDLAPNRFLKIMSFKKKIDCYVWITANGTDTAIGHKKVNLGTQQFEMGKKLYNIDYSAIQNKMGKLVYNTDVNNCIGALRFNKSSKNVDAKNAKEILQRNWLTALWGSWKLPFIITLIAIIAMIISVTILGIIVPQYMRQGEILADNKVMIAEKDNQISNLRLQLEQSIQNPDYLPPS